MSIVAQPGKPEINAKTIVDQGDPR